MSEEETELPILGEPAPVELANSLYGEGDDQVDFLATSELARRWFAEAELGTWPRHADAESQARLIELRNAVVDLVTASLEERDPRRASVAVVNRCAAEAPTVGRLVWSRGDAPSAEVLFRGGRTAQLLGQLAVGTIELLTGPRAERLRRCVGPGCRLLFVQHHRRRRFCHEECSHRARQMRYYRKSRSLA